MKVAKGVKFAYAVRFGLCDNPACGCLHVDLLNKKMEIFASAVADKKCAEEWTEGLRRFMSDN